MMMMMMMMMPLVSREPRRKHIPWRCRACSAAAAWKGDVDSKKKKKKGAKKKKQCRPFFFQNKHTEKAHLELSGERRESR